MTSKSDEIELPSNANEDQALKSMKTLLENLRNTKHAMDNLRTQLDKVSKRKISKKLSDKCVHCYVKVDIENLKEFVTCKGCDQLVCHNQKCSEFVFGLDIWECARCKKNRIIQQRAGEWLLKQLNQMKDANSESSRSEVDERRVASNNDDENLASFVSRNQREKVRQFIEELLARMLDGPLDDVPVGQLSNDENCLPIIGPIPSTVKHQELKMFVQGICEEISRFPNTVDFSGVAGERTGEPLPYFDPKKYEKLLATAVLNKMTDYFQNDKNQPYTGPELASKHSDIELDNNHNQVNSKAVIDLMASRDDEPSTRLERLNSKAIDDETHLSDYLQSHFVPLPDLSGHSDSTSVTDDAEVQSITSSNGTDGTWEDNWLFKKRKLKTENQSIAMLVPTPTEEIRALIGDKNADETSDLSENSDVENDDDDVIVEEEDEEEEKKTFNSSILIEPKEISTVIIRTTPAEPDVDSLISMDITDPNIVIEASNSLLNCGVKNPLMGSTDRLLNELTVDVNQSKAEEDFNSIISPTQVYIHRKSIDRLFEDLVTDNNNNNEHSKPEVKSKQEKEVEVKAAKSLTTLETPVKKDKLEVGSVEVEDDDWEIVPNIDDDCHLQSLSNDESASVSTTTSLTCHPATSIQLNRNESFENLAELEDDKSPKSPSCKRYSSPIFENLLPAAPIEPVKVSKTLSIPNDNSIDNLLEVASLISKTQKSPALTDTVMINDEMAETQQTNTDNNNKIDDNHKIIVDNEDNEVYNEWISANFVVDKRPSFHDPEVVLMQNVVPGSIAEREHIKWLKAAPIEKNPYSSEALQRRLSETDQKSKVIDLSNHKLITAITEESKNAENDRDEPDTPIEDTQKVDMRKYKRDYYINDANENRLSNSSSTSQKSQPMTTTKNPTTMINVVNSDHDDDHSDRIVPVTTTTSVVTSEGGGFRFLSLNPSGDIDSAGVSIASDQDNSDHRSNNDDSITFSEDSDATRIYNLNTRETKIVSSQHLTPIIKSPQTPPVESPLKVTHQQQFFKDFAIPNSKMENELSPVVEVLNGKTEFIEEAYEEKQVIEPEVIDSLPSVRKLAQLYLQENNKPKEVQLNKPRSFLANESEAMEHRKAFKTSSDTFIPKYDHDYHPAMPIASITARSIPLQVRAELKKSHSYDQETIVRHDEREGSPEIQAGVTRNSIAFFENLKKIA